MKDFIKKFYRKGENVTTEEVFKFISSYCELFTGQKLPDAHELQIITTLIQHGVFSLEYAVDIASKKIGMNVTKLYDKVGNVIKVEIEE